MVFGGEGVVCFSQVFNLLPDVYTAIVLMAITIFTCISLRLKKNKSVENSKLTRYKEEKIIEDYQPEELVEGLPKNRNELKPRIIRGKVGLYLEIDGMKCLNFGCHNYLGFVGNGRIENEAIECLEVFGMGSCGPRGFYGTTTKHTELERCLARILDCEDSIIYPYGFSTIASAIPAYAKKVDIIFVDEKRNFAIHQGLAASQSTVYLFQHNNTNDLEQKMEKSRLRDLKNPNKAKCTRKYLVVEGISVNTGKICPLPEIVRLCKKYKVRLFVDESVSLGVLGKTGKGVTEYFSIPRSDVDLTMGSFEYALGSVGGFCAGARLFTDHQQMTGQGYCFSASLSPPLAAATIEALHIIESNPQMFARLQNLCNILHFKLNSSAVIKKYFYISGDQDSPIHLLEVKDGDSHCSYDVLEYCLEKNVAIAMTAFLDGVDRAMDVSSLRITTSVYNSECYINYLICVLEEACKSIFIK